MAPAWLPPSAQDIDLAARLRSNERCRSRRIRGLVLRNGLARRRGNWTPALLPAITMDLAYVYFEDEPGPRSVRSGPHSRLSLIAFAADECKSLCELPLTREG